MIACLDLVALATLSRMAVEDIGPRRFPGQAAALLAVHRTLEAEPWKLSEWALTQTQQADLAHDACEVARPARRRRHGAVHALPGVRAAGAHAARQCRQVPAVQLIGLDGLDPMAGLDPAVRQVEQTRLLAARAIFYAQRVPILMDLQLDGSLNRMGAGPESGRVQEETGPMKPQRRMVLFVILTLFILSFTLFIPVKCFSSYEALLVCPPGGFPVAL